MAKIPFSIEYRPQIESGEYKVETRSGIPVRIVCWNRKSKDMEILALVYDEHIDEDNEELVEVALNGRMFPRGKDHDYDLFIVVPEEELTEFETALMEFVNAREPKNPMTPEGAKNNGSILLNIAKEQFIKDGYIIEKKGFHDAVEKADKEVIKEVSDNVDKTNELTEFESKLSWIISYAIINPTKSTPTNEYAKKSAKELLTLARKELVGEMLTSVPKESALYKAGVLDGKAEALKEIEQDPESSYAFKRGVEYGKKEALKGLSRSEDKEATIKVGDRVLIHCKSTRDKTIKHIYDNQEGEVLHVWDLKGNPWGNIHVRIEGGYNNGFLLEELEKLPGFKGD